MSISLLGSIRFTIPLLTITGLVVAIATFLEGMSGSHRLAEGWIYQHPLFYFLLFCFFINILFATFNRWPFKLHHIPFLCAHLGLLMLILGVTLKGLFGLQGMIRLHEGEGSHLALLLDRQGIFGRDKDWRFSFRVVPGRPFKEREILFTPLEILPHGEKRWDGWISDGRLTIYGLPSVELVAWDGEVEPPKTQLPDLDITVIKSDEPLLSLLPWKGEKPWLILLMDSEEKISVNYLHPDGFRYTTFNPKSPGEIVIYDSGRGGYGVEMPPFSSPLTLKMLALPAPKNMEEARPILRLKGEKGENAIETLLPYDPDGGGLATPFFDTLIKFQPLAVKIPHHLRLFQAKTLYRPGATTPESYEAKISVDGHPFTLRMNEVYESPLGYRFYLSNIHGAPGEVKEVHLAVNHDPTKYILTYPGGLLIIFGAILLLFKHRHLNQKFNELEKGKSV